MARKSLGFTHLIWVCPNCRTRNPGPEKKCISCGLPQPKDVHFEQAGKEDLIEDNEEISRAKTGADIHCPYCGTRNPANASVCSQCLGDLTEGTKRESGRVVGAYKKVEDKPLVCPACGSHNPFKAAKCINCGSPFRKTEKEPTAEKQSLSDKTRLILIGIGVLVVICAVVFISRSLASDEFVGRVNQVNWQRSIQVEQYQMIVKNDWWDRLPEDAEVNDCVERYRFTSDTPVEDAIEVCGTPYTVDQGSGYGEVVQDCQYQVYDYYCEYESAEWVQISPLVQSGSGLNAMWPAALENSNQRYGNRSEVYTIVFDTESGIKRFTTSDYLLYQQAQIGTQWELLVDGFGNIKSISRR